MTISRRNLLSTGGALLGTVTLGIPTVGAATEGENGILIALLAAAAITSGDEAPKPLNVTFSERDRKRLSALKPRDQTQALAEMLTQKLSRGWDMKITPIPVEAVSKALGGAGLREGEYAVRALNKGPKFEIKITIVIKF